MASRFLPTPLRKALERAVLAARITAEAGAEDAIRRLGVADVKAPGHLSKAEQATRRRLRAHARTLGDETAADGTHAVTHLVEAAAYAQWHRRLFARFLAERQLLRHPVHAAPVTLEDVEELAAEEGFADGWSAAESYAARMLPAVFQPNDPVLALALAPEHAQALRKLVLALDPETFQADDSLGWTYQFWRTAEKKRVNDSQVKIGAAELPAVTQLFTEPYMVRFLLHNTLGAWRAGKVLAARPDLAAEAPDEDALRAAVALPDYDFDMLRFVKGGEDAPRWRPAAGTYPGWPTEAAQISVLDPCCGSGHFLTEALTILAGMRSQEEGLTPAETVAAVLRDNLFGLEIDGRCVQIAAFAVALSAWRLGGFQTLPSPHIAWVGAPPPLAKPEFMALANGDAELREGLDKLWDVFRQAPLLGSLIEPAYGDLISPQRLGRIAPLLDKLVERTRDAEPARAEGAVAARGMADAAAILTGRYTLQTTNVPYLSHVKQGYDLSAHLSSQFPNSKADLATTMLERMHRLSTNGGSVSAVAPQNWLYQPYYKKFRKDVLSKRSINVIGALGSGAFETISGEVVTTILIIMDTVPLKYKHEYSAIDANDIKESNVKATALVRHYIEKVDQGTQLNDSERRIVIKPSSSFPRLAKEGTFHLGICTGDYERFGRDFWEIFPSDDRWSLQQTTIKSTKNYGGYQKILFWQKGNGDLLTFVNERLDGNVASWLRGREAWGKRGVLVSAMGDLPVSIYEGNLFDSNSVVVIPKEEPNLSAVWAFMSADSYKTMVRDVSRALKVQGDLIQVPLDMDHWRRNAAAAFPDGLPQPYSEDPTQWLFHGHPAKSEAGVALHVAMARLAGYRWPAESDPDMRLSVQARDWIAKAQTLPEADGDGILTLCAGGGDRQLVERLRAFLAMAFGDQWDEALERRLVVEADARLDKKVAKDGSLEAWLRDRAFRQHCKLFQDRPFLWQVWDGRADGFSAFLHYHRLDNGTLQKLTYSILGDWIRRRKDEGDEACQEAAQILQNKLVAILEGEKPFDIFVRWKPPADQPLGWTPDLDAGVRLNIRPWVTAGVLRETPKLKWGVDRGKDVASAPWFDLDQGVRDNDRHTTLAEKRAATRKPVNA